jgi:hypothetical protein
LEVIQTPESKISDEIKKLVRRSNISPGTEIRVIISLKDGASLKDAERDLAEKGLKVENAVPGPIPFVSGTISLDKITEAAVVKVVKKVELDSEIRAL